MVLWLVNPHTMTWDGFLCIGDAQEQGRSVGFLFLTSWELEIWNTRRDLM